MPRTVTQTLTTAFVFLALATSATVGGDAVEEAKARLDQGDSYAAVDRLETAIPDTSATDLPGLLDLLREAYTKAAAKAESEGKPREAAHYREGRELLGDAKATPQPKPAEPAQIVPKPKAAEPAPKTRDESPFAELARADAAWKAKKYIDAGKGYASLARAEKLPPGRRDHWAYCRLVAILERINAGPESPADWAEIHAEIDHIRLLSPKNWYGEYLRNVVVERSGGVRRAKADALVVRGAAPDEAQSPPRVARTRVTNPAKVAARDAAPTPEAPPAAEPPRFTPAPDAAVGVPGPPQGKWQTFVTPSFRIFHNDEALARKAATRAEAARRAAAKFWTGAEPASPWTPKCDLYLYPTAEVFAAQTQQPAESPGFSTAGLEGGRVTVRMVKLRVDYPKMLDAVLPHEITHVVLADLFPTKQIPRWADEGMAVLSEPAIEQALRVRDLAGPVREDVLFRLDVLMSADYPSGAHWALYYAQSVSLTRYLVGQGTPQQFVNFVRASQQKGIDAALRGVYRIESITELERRWKVHAREAVNPATASADDGSDKARK
jgi:Peptidase MA superfamily